MNMKFSEQLKLKRKKVWGGVSVTKITAWIMSIFLGICGTVAVFLPFGNPISKLLVTKNAEIYLEENYQGKDYYIDEVNYDFKTGNYYVLIESESSADSSFTVYAGTNGKISYDTYESAVVNKWNTAGRINDEYRAAVDKVLTSSEFPYNQHIGFGDIEFCESDRPADSSVPDYAISVTELELDGVYDILDMGRKAGHLTVYIYDNDVSAERLAEILLGIRSIMDKSEVGFYAVDCVLEYPRPEDDGPWREGRVEVMSFRYSDIYEEGITERVKESNEKAEQYYKEQDALKN